MSVPSLHATMVTFSGRYVSLLAPTPDDVHEVDLAHHLATINRFTGAAIRPLSVAEHSLLCLHIARMVLKVTDPVVHLCVLLHDAHEAYLQDDTTPKRQAVQQLSCAAAVAQAELRGRFDRAIGIRFGIQGASEAARDVIRRCDLIALATERRDLVADQARDWPALTGVKPADCVDLRAHDGYTWSDWKRAFLDVLHHLRFSIKDRREQLYGSGTPPRP